ncbi:MAG: C4-type zinc ribbon domain-containing protein [Candidatus Eisenbacteria bacterium]|nr:C4-type zinc ribbon domain-containing protein [Candidatus Eisenbacteria bacterium]
MREQLIVLPKLQEKDTGLRQLSDTIRGIPERIKAIEERIKTLDGVCASKKSELDIAMKKRREKERDLDSLSEEQKKFERQLFDVRTNKEYQALLHEIEQVKTKRSDIETVILELLEAEERLTAELTTSLFEHKRAQEKGAREKAELDKELADAKQKVESLRAEREELASSLKPDLKARYERILESKAGQAVAEVKRGGCGGCFAVLPPQTVNEVRKREKVISCEACGRILIWLDQDPEKQGDEGA